MAMLLVSLTKPFIDTGLILSANPSKNYILNLLRAKIQEFAPTQSLDAGTGLLRNYWMFPGDYTGTSISMSEVRSALADKRIQRQIAKRSTPRIFLTRLDSDLSYLGSFEMCVCTHTLSYVSDAAQSVRNLSRLVVKGGTLILQGEIEELSSILNELGGDYADIEIVYYGIPQSDYQLPAYDIAEYERLTKIELEAKNIPEGHSNFFIVARNKKFPAILNGHPTRFVSVDGVMVAEIDLQDIIDLEKRAVVI